MKQEHLNQYVESLKELLYMDSYTGSVVKFDFNPALRVKGVC